MAPSIQVSASCCAPSVAWLLCAACGPLPEVLLPESGIRPECEPGIRFRQRCYEVESPVPFPQLYRWVQLSEAAREEIRRVEKRRRAAGYRQRPLVHAEIAASARAALLLDDKKSFERLYARYAEGISHSQWHPDPFLTCFWESLFGPGWEGIEFIPEGAAREEAAVALSNVRSFLPGAPGMEGYAVTEEGRLAEAVVASALQAADVAALEPLLHKGNPVAVAAHAFLEGEQEEAQRYFERSFGRALDKRYGFALSHSLVWLIYAIIGRVFRGGSPLYLGMWFCYARHALSCVFPDSMKKAQAELGRFLDHLELVDNLVNRHGESTQEPEFHGALSFLPFAMAYAALPLSLRGRLKQRELVQAVDYAARGGLCLLARYGASGLLQAGNLCLRDRQRLEGLLEGVDSRTLPQLPFTAAERAYAQLQASVRTYARRFPSPFLPPAAHAPVLVASRTRGGVVLRLEEWEAEGGSTLPPALRCLRSCACNGRVVLEGVAPVELTRLFVALQPQLEVVGSLAAGGESVVAADARPVLLLSRRKGGGFLAALRLRLLPGAAPPMAAGCGLSVPILEGADGCAVAVQRDMKAEWRVVEKQVASLEQAGVSEAGKLLHAEISLGSFSALARLLECCREFGLETCWEEEEQLRFFRPQGGLNLCAGNRTSDWLELGGGLPVDEGRVLELSALLAAFMARKEDVLELGGGEYVLLTPALERQLTLLSLVRQQRRGQWGVAASAMPLLEGLSRSNSDLAAAGEPPAALPAGLQATLRPYQIAGFRWLAERAGMGVGGLLADDMGLGKTVQLLALLLHAAEQGAALVVAPVSLMDNWAQEAARFAPSLLVMSCAQGVPDALSGLGPGVLVLASYGQVAAHLQAFCSIHWNVLVLDEAQAIKNPDSRRAKAVCALHARARFCLTGTPVENSLLDLWSQMRFLNPGLFGPRAAFLQRFKRAGEGGLTLLRQALLPLVLRRSRAEVLSELPPLTESTEWVEFSREERALYESLRRAAVQKLGQGGRDGGVSILAELTRLRRACCHGKLALPDFGGQSSKLAAMADRVEELRAAGHRVLIFSQFTDVLDLALHCLQERAITCLRLDGSTPAKQRSALVRAFQRGEADTILISIKAGGSGLNLTAADYVMLLDPWWNPAVEAQAAGRSHRMGQHLPVTLCRFIVRGTVEERILELHQHKQKLAESVLSASGEGLNLESLRELLSAVAGKSPAAQVE